MTTLLDIDEELLDEALSRARATTAFETAVFANSESGGFMYWTSKHPDCLNTTVLDFFLPPSPTTPPRRAGR